MYPEGVDTISIKDQVKSDFLALVDFLSTRLSFPWWFAVKEDARNRHSLARAIGITRDELLSVLEIFGVCRKRGKIINVRNDVVLWAQTNGLKTYFNSESNINLSRSKCTLSNKLQLLLRLGAPIDSDCVSIPSLQRLEDVSPVERLELDDQRLLRNLKNAMKKSIRSLNGGESSLDVADLDECDDSIARRDTTTVSNSNTIDNTSNSLSSLDHLDSSSIAHSSSINTATLEVVQKEVLTYADTVVRERNANLVEAYKKIGENVKNTTPIPMTETELKKNATLATFNVPLIPVLLKNLVKDLIHFGTGRDKLDDDQDILSFIGDNSHPHTIITMLKPKNLRSFNTHCRQKVKDLPGTLLKPSKYKDLNEIEKEAAKLKDIGEIRKWCIEALLEDDTEAQDALQAVAENKLGMMKKKKMQAPEIGAMLKLFGILPTSFLGVKSFMETHWGFQMFASKTSLRQLHIDSIIPTTEETDDELKLSIGTRI